MLRCFICLGLLLSLSACGGMGESYPRSKVVTARKIACSGDSAVETRGAYTVYSPVEVALAIDGKTYVMKQERSAQGMKYAGNGASFWNKGIDGLFEVKGGPTYSCRFLPDDVSFDPVPVAMPVAAPVSAAPPVPMAKPQGAPPPPLPPVKPTNP